MKSVRESPPAAVPGADGPTRERLVTELLVAGPASAAELAGRLGLTAAGVRRHLDALLAEGRIVPRDPPPRGPRGRGRPARRYAVTEAGRDRFRKDYDTLALSAIAELVATLGPGALDRLAATHFSPIREAYQRQAARPGADLEGASLALAGVLDEAGYAASLTPVPSGEQLCQRHCPVAEIARAYPQLCEVETELIGTLLASRVQRLATIAHGDGVCTTHIPAAPSPREGRPMIHEVRP